MEQVTEQALEQLTQQAVEKMPILMIPQLWIRLSCIGALAFLLFLFVNPMIFGIRHAGCYAGCAVCIPGILFFVMNPRISVWLDGIWKNSSGGRVLLCVLAGFLAVCALFGVVVSICMCSAIHKQPKAESTVVILGCKVRGTAPSFMLKRRLDAASAYLQAHPKVPVIVCGGQGRDEAISEAQCMADYLKQNGIAASRIFQEDKSTSTQENLRNAKEILERELFDSHVSIVTDGFHQFRASLIAKDCGLTCDAIPAETAWYLVPSYWVREWLGVADFLIFG